MVKDLCIEIIDKCPNNCLFCSSNSCYEKNTIISFNDFKRVIDYFISQGGIEEISLSGGEPFLHPNIIDMIKYCKKFNIRTVIFTSGIKNISHDEETIDFYIKEMNDRLKEVEESEPWNKFLKNKIINHYSNFISKPEFSSISKPEFIELKKIGLDKIVFDFQAYEEETDYQLMGRNEKRRICLFNSILNASYADLNTDVHFIPMKPNYKQIKDILELLEIADIKNISILKFVPQGRGKINAKELMLNEEEIKKFMELLNKHKKYYSGSVRIGIPLQGNNTHLCNAGLEKLDIKFDGTVLPCPAFKEIDIDTMKKYGIKYYNIYENLEEIKTPGGKRKEPLCQKIYKR